jgi:hypothetical protein
MIRIPHQWMLAAAFALFCAACGGPTPADEARAALRADSAFATPVTIRIPRSIRVTASAANSGASGFSGIARFGPEHFHRLNAPMNVLSAAGVLRVADRSQRMLVRSLRTGTSSCVPYHYRTAPGPHPSCHRVNEQRIYDYSHRVQVSPTAALGAEWREDTEPWEPSFGLAGAEFSPGWVVELARREIVDVGEVRNPEIGALEVDYTWRWAVTPTGSHFDPAGATQRALPSSLRTFAIARMAEAPRADTVYNATALLLRIDGAWKMSDVRFK